MLRETEPITIEPIESAEWQPYANGNGTNGNGTNGKDHQMLSGQETYQLPTFGENLLRIQEERRMRQWIIPMAALFTYISSHVSEANLTASNTNNAAEHQNHIHALDPERMKKVLKKYANIIFKDANKRQIAWHLEHFIGITKVQFSELLKWEQQAGRYNGNSALNKDAMLQNISELLTSVGWQPDSFIPISAREEGITYQEKDLKDAIDALFGDQRSHFPFEQYEIYKKFSGNGNGHHTEIEGEIQL